MMNRSDLLRDHPNTDVQQPKFFLTFLVGKKVWIIGENIGRVLESDLHEVGGPRHQPRPRPARILRPEFSAHLDVACGIRVDNAR